LEQSRKTEERITDAETGWWGKIYSIRTHQSVLPTPTPGRTKSQDGGKPGGEVWTARKAQRLGAGKE